MMANMDAEKETRLSYGRIPTANEVNETHLERSRSAHVQARRNGRESAVIKSLVWKALM